jgi:hypothetical protein
MTRIILTAVLFAAASATAGEVKFKTHRIGNFRSEAVAVADFTGDGKLDVLAGEFLYPAPDWKPVKVRAIKGKVDDNGKGYRWDFMNAPLEIAGSGRPDLVSVDWFQKHVVWYRNTGTTAGEWPETVIATNGNFETGDLVDLDGTGKKTAILPHVSQTVWYERSGNGFAKHVVSTKGMAFGAGVGDINGDGRIDVMRPNAWFESPADPRKGQWIERAWNGLAGGLGAKDGKAEHTAQILAFDANGDGRTDIIASSAHKYGIFWYEQIRNADNQITWKQHTIDDTWTQAHSLLLADIDGCGVPELLTGKRFMAHNGSDPDEAGKLGVYYYKLHRNADRAVTWSKHIISYDEGIGSGLNLCVGDMFGHGRLDVIVTGKWGGPVIFENLGDR